MIHLTTKWAIRVETAAINNLFKLHWRGRILRPTLDKKLKEIRQEKPLTEFINRMEEEYETQS